MKCPYRTITVHQPEYTEGYQKIYAEDITEFADCYGKDCPHYDWVYKVCKKVKMEEGNR